MAEKTFVNSKRRRNNATIIEFVNIWIKIYCMKELKPTTTYSIQITLKNHVLPVLGRLGLYK